MLSPILSIENVELLRFPQTRDINLRAWNAADEYILNHLSQQSDALTPKQTLIINDQFGALNVCLNSFNPWYWTDSFLSNTAQQKNHQLNGLTSNSERSIFWDITSEQLKPTNKNKSMPQSFDLVIIKVPKQLNMLALQLSSLQPYISSKTQIIAAGMTKEIHNSTLALFEKWAGKTKTSLAKKKARLIFSTPQNIITSPQKKTTVQTVYQLANPLCSDQSLKVCSLPNVFSQGRLDIGSKVLLNHFPKISSDQSLLDLGCGSGVIAAAIAQANQLTHVTLTDESAMAIAASRQTFLLNQLPHPKLIQTNVLDNVQDHFDVIVCNPPFHQQNTQTLSIANKMFKQSSSHLNSHGEFWVIANRHLQYGKQLSQYFDKVTIKSKDSKFILWHASRPKKPSPSRA